MKSLFILLIAIFLVGCVSENQQKGLDDIAYHYDAETSYTKSYKNSAGSKKTTTFNVNVSNSKMLDTLRADITTSNIALMMFDSFTEDEKKDYTYLNVTLIKKAKDTVSYNFFPEVLNVGLDQVSIFIDFSEKLLAKDYKGIFNNIDPTIIESDTFSLFTNYLDQLTNDYGDITAYKRYGFGILKQKTGEELLGYSGILTFNNGFTKTYYIITSKQKDNNYVLGYNLE